ncbi:MAG: mechanosensitive ion channel family protein [Anaerolineae bacterium]
MPLRDFLEQELLANPVWRWIAAPLAAALIMVLLRLLRSMLVARIRRIAERTANQIDDLVVDVLDSTRPLLMLPVAIYAGSLILSLDETISSLLRTLAIIALLIQAGLWLVRLLTFVLGAYVRRSSDDASSESAVRTLSFITRLVVWSVIGVLVLDNIPGVEVSSLIAGLGITGIAVALAVQNILGDLFASLSILLDKPFVIGDSIRVDEMQGTVEHIGLKTTRVRSINGEELVFANSDLLNSRIRNFKRMEERFVIFTIGVLYETPPEKLERIPAVVEEVINGVPKAHFARAHLTTFGASSLDFEIAYHVLDRDYATYLDTHHAISLMLLRRFQQEGIEFAYPTQLIYLNRVAEAAS